MRARAPRRGNGNRQPGKRRSAPPATRKTGNALFVCIHLQHPGSHSPHSTGERPKGKKEHTAAASDSSPVAPLAAAVLHFQAAAAYDHKPTHRGRPHLRLAAPNSRDLSPGSRALLLPLPSPPRTPLPRRLPARAQAHARPTQRRRLRQFPFQQPVQVSQDPAAA